ncbi:hypothetical protein QTV49_000548 [Vibrio vulnificus]|nr:hypothetical protein [Vibrio vulnificus]
MKSNHLQNISLLNDQHNYIELTNIEQVEPFLKFLEWLLPYSHPESVERHLVTATSRINRVGVVYFNLFGLSYHYGIDRATTLCLLLQENDSFKSHSNVIKWDDFVKPLYIESERDDLSLTPDMKALLARLANQ